jgi:hypothetical protein
VGATARFNRTTITASGRRSGTSTAVFQFAGDAGAAAYMFCTRTPMGTHAATLIRIATQIARFSRTARRAR